MKVGHSGQGGVWTRLGVNLAIEVLGGSSPAQHKHWCSTHLQHVQDLSFTAQMPVLGGGKGRQVGAEHCGGFHTPFLLSLSCTRGWGVLLPCASCCFVPMVSLIVPCWHRPNSS